MAAKKATTPYLQWFLTCEAVQTDDDGNFSFRHIFDGFTVSGLPAEVHFTVAAQFRGGQGRHMFWLKIVAPDGKEQMTTESSFWLDSPSAAHRFATRVRMRVGQPGIGKHRISAILNGRVLMEIPLTVDVLATSGEPDVIVE